MTPKGTQDKRRQQALDAIRAKPGISPKELAKQLGISLNYGYTILGQFQLEGLVVGSGSSEPIASSLTLTEDAPSEADEIPSRRTRADQVRSLITAEAGITIEEISDKVGISEAYVTDLVEEMEADHTMSGEGVREEDGKLYPT